MGRSPCCEKVGLKKGPWTPEEDQKLLAYIEEHGHGSWRALPAKAGLQRCGKSCRLRWTNYLRPDIKRGKFSLQEEQTIIQLHALLGNRWSAIATHLPKRTDNEIKNYWNTHLKKRLAKMGIDPVTHKPKADALGSSAADGGHSRSAANLSHMAQWESARLEAEARLARESKLRSQASAFLQPPSSPPPQLGRPSPPPCLDVLRAWEGVWSKPTAAAAAGGGIDMESPTSTSGFSETLQPMIAGMGGMVDVNSTMCHGSEFEGEEVEWKCFSKPARATSSAFSMDETIFGGDGPWLGEAASGGIDSLPPVGDFGSGFTEMLLESSDEHNNSSEGCGESDNVDGGGSCVEEGEEENKNYWNSILNLVNSSSPSNSPPVF